MRNCAVRGCGWKGLLPRPELQPRIVMPKVNKTNLRAGDIVLFEWNNKFWHTAIYVGDVGKVKSGIAHCEGAKKGTAIDPLAGNHDEAANVYAFRIPTAYQDALRKVMALVQAWAPAGSAQNTTNYGNPRGSAVLQEYDKDHAGTTPPFEYDALYRVFKWLDGRERFSKNQGTTCCAFVIACFQAGMMNYFIEQNGLQQSLANIQFKLRNERAGKTKAPNPEEIFRQELAQKKGVKASKIAVFKDEDAKKIQARKQYRNPGTKMQTFTDVDALWEDIKTNVCYLQDNTTTLQEIVTDPLFCDAKFTYSHTLYERLRLDNGWTLVQ
jgi:hypothetical protein